MKRSTAGLSILAVMALTACSSPAPMNDGPTGDASSPSASAAPTLQTMPAGDFELTTTSGAYIKFKLPTPPTDPAVADLEAFRVAAGGEPVTYLAADVDNRIGSELVNMYQVSAYDVEGKEYTFSAAWQMVDMWEPNYEADGSYTSPSGEVLDPALGEKLSRQGMDVHNAHLHGADPAERKTIVLVAPGVGLPDEFTRVAVQPSGMGPGEEAKPASR